MTENMMDKFSWADPESLVIAKIELPTPPRCEICLLEMEPELTRIPSDSVYELAWTCTSPYDTHLEMWRRREIS